ncbi:MAG: hypothetical protein OEQ53_03815 [Saprospiraceae bacterium]|nr:hypothetical protein [Saprospiraceae bacterium]
MQFRQVLGQEDIKHYLREVVEKDRIPHALIFLGASGYGTLPMAMAFAQYVMCEDRQAGDSCGRCRHCYKSAKRIHPDIHYTFPTIGSKSTSAEFSSDWRSFLEQNMYAEVFDWFNRIGGDNRQGNITKDECLRLLKALSMKTFEGEFKVQILWMPEFLGREGNRLLKLIEEPPDNTLFILVGQQQEEILNTITSRCQLVPFKPLDEKVLRKHLIENFPRLKGEEVDQISVLAKGDLNIAIDLAEQKEGIAANIWLEWMRIAYKGNGVEMVSWSDRFNRLDREAQKNFFRYGLYFFREMILYQLYPEHQILLMEKESLAMRKLSNLIELRSIQEAIELANDSIFHLERNGNARIVMLDNSIQLNKILRGKIPTGNRFTKKQKS